MTPSSKRLFLALWPDNDVRLQVHKLQQSLIYDPGLATASPVDINNVHITLHFLGQVAEKDISMLMQAVSSVSENCFDIELDRLGYFSRPKILWLGATGQYDVLNQLYKATSRAIKKCIPGYRPRKYVLHATLFRKAVGLPQKEVIEKIFWPANSFVLVESKTYPEGVQYRVLNEWPLN